jgi:hypothetical protein
MLEPGSFFKIKEEEEERVDKLLAQMYLMTAGHTEPDS